MIYIRALVIGLFLLVLFLMKYDTGQIFGSLFGRGKKEKPCKAILGKKFDEKICPAHEIICEERFDELDQEAFKSLPCRHSPTEQIICEPCIDICDEIQVDFDREFEKAPSMQSYYPPSELHEDVCTSDICREALEEVGRELQRIQPMSSYEPEHEDISDSSFNVCEKILEEFEEELNKDETCQICMPQQDFQEQMSMSSPCSICQQDFQEQIDMPSPCSFFQQEDFQEQMSMQSPCSVCQMDDIDDQIDMPLPSSVYQHDNIEDLLCMKSSSLSSNDDITDHDDPSDSKLSEEMLSELERRFKKSIDQAKVCDSNFKVCEKILEEFEDELRKDVTCNTCMSFQQEGNGDQIRKSYSTSQNENIDVSNVLCFESNEMPSMTMEELIEEYGDECKICDIQSESQLSDLGVLEPEVIIDEVAGEKFEPEINNLKEELMSLEEVEDSQGNHTKECPLLD